MALAPFSHEIVANGFLRGGPFSRIQAAIALTKFLGHRGLDRVLRVARIDSRRVNFSRPYFPLLFLIISLHSTDFRCILYQTHA